MMEAEQMRNAQATKPFELLSAVTRKNAVTHTEMASSRYKSAPWEETLVCV